MYIRWRTCMARQAASYLAEDPCFIVCMLVSRQQTILCDWLEQDEPTLSESLRLSSIATPCQRDPTHDCCLSALLASRFECKYTRKYRALACACRIRP